jgi:hypothetical protein
MAWKSQPKTVLLAAVSLTRKKPSLVTWCFFSGMVILGIDSLFKGLSLRAADLPEMFAG